MSQNDKRALNIMEDSVQLLVNGHYEISLPWKNYPPQRFLCCREISSEHLIFLTGSHHGGAWDRCISTTRKVIKAVMKEQVLDDEGINTLMCEVEAVVNGRPITKLSDDPRDMEPLAPNHLLLLRVSSAAFGGYILAPLV